MFSLRPPRTAVLTPCIGVCTLRADGLCEGCLRNAAEIAGWSSYDDATRRRLMDDVLPLRGSGPAGRCLLPWPIASDRLLPLDSPPAGPAWNLHELADLLPAWQPRVAAAVMIGLVQRVHGPGVLLTLRTDTLSRHAGQVSFPGGRIDPGDAGPVAAALRETAEEVAIPPSQLAPLGFLDPYDTVTGFRILPVVAELDPGYRATPDPAEVAEAFEVPLEWLFEPTNCERVDAELGGRMRHYWQFRFGRHLIWGATASMLLNLRLRLTGAHPPS